MATTLRTRSIPANSDQIIRARRHVAMLEARGWSRQAIARAAGVAPSSITKLANAQDPHLTRSVVVAVLEVGRC